MAVRRTTADPETASAIETLIRARSEGLYALGAKVRELGTAREAVKAAQDRERELLAEAVELQQRTVAAGWTPEELRQAGLYVGAPVVRRRRSTLPVTDPEPEAEAAQPVPPAGDGGELDGGTANGGADGQPDGGGPVE